VTDNATQEYSFMDLIAMARDAGMQVLLDAQIGRQSYHSVCGSLNSLQKFADAVRETMKLELATSDVSGDPGKA
jgi:hypothetical protein